MALDKSEAPPISHQAGRFEWLIDQQRCVLEYRRDGDTLVFTHTGVPPALRGRGLAAVLVAHGLRWARAQDLKVVAACSYVADYLKRHPPA